MNCFTTDKASQLRGQLKTGDRMSKVLQHKVVAALPSPLEPDSIYYVRAGAGFDIYVTNGVGVVTAYSLNADVKLDEKVDSTDPRLTNSREWSEDTVAQEEAEAGTASTRRAWTAQRVRQAINAWWQLVTSGFGRNFIAASNEQAARNVLQLGSAATRDAADLVPLKSLRNFNSGTLIKTDIDRYRAWLLHITGNSYSSGGPPFQLSVQGYDYEASSAYMGGGISSGVHLTGLWSFYYENKLCFWIPQGGYWQGYNVSVFDVTYQGAAYNQAVSITDEPKPTDTINEADLIPLIRRTLNSSDVLQSTGQSTQYPMSQKAVTDALNTKISAGEWVDLRPYLKSGFYYDSARNGRNSHPRIRKLSCGRVELDGIVSFNATSGPMPIGVFVNVPAQFRPALTVGGLMFGDTASPLSFGAVNWIVIGQVEYAPPAVHGDISMIPLTLASPAQDAALSLNGIYWFT